MDAELLVTLPLPPRELSPNGRPHWRVKAKRTAEYRKRSAEEAMVAAWENAVARRSMPWSEVSVEVRYFHKTIAFQDRDNILASLKAAFDSFVDAGVLTDDRDVTYLPVVRAKDSANPRVELRIRPLTASGS
jgi:crossover junction endodeoxyribonuclease RusA